MNIQHSALTRGASFRVCFHPFLHLNETIPFGHNSIFPDAILRNVCDATVLCTDFTRLCIALGANVTTVILGVIGVSANLVKVFMIS